MSTRTLVFVATIYITTFTAPLAAQVEKVAIRTTGISCGVCAGVSEIQFRRIPDVSAVAISLSSETISLSYRTGAPFSLRQIHQVLDPLQVGILQLRIAARGRVVEESGKRFFLAGKDRFTVSSAARASAIPLNTPVLIDGVVNDRIDLAELKILDFKLLEK